jgi:lipoate-protein ligase A
MMGDMWSIEERVGPAGMLHASWPATETHPSRRAIAVCRVTRPAVVLGSTQVEGVVDSRRAGARGIELVRRRSGGGAVLVTPGDPVWVDAWVPRGDPLWNDDVGRAFDWLGDAWTTALGAVGCQEMSAHRGGYAASTRWSSLVCFGGVGTGEVVTSDGRKVVGVSQRRNRNGAWFHSACVLEWDATELLGVLDLPDAERAAARLDLADAVTGVVDLVGTSDGGVIDGPTMVTALVDALPS